MGLASGQATHQAGPANEIEIGVGWESRRRARAWCIQSWMACAVLDAEQLEDLKRHTRRGMRGRVRAGISPTQRRRPAGARWCGPRWSSCSTTRPSSARPTRSPNWPRRWKWMSLPSSPRSSATTSRASKGSRTSRNSASRSRHRSHSTLRYYAVQIFPLARKNFGGVNPDLQCRVLDRHFEPIGGLYAAGEVAGMAGGHINGRAGLEGTMLGPSIFSDASPAAGPPMQLATVAAFPASRTARELDHVQTMGAQLSPACSGRDAAQRRQVYAVSAGLTACAAPLTRDRPTFAARAFGLRIASQV